VAPGRLSSSDNEARRPRTPFRTGIPRKTRLLALFSVLEPEEMEGAAGVASQHDLETIEQYAALSRVKVANTVPVSRSHAFSVWSSDAETARCPSGVTDTSVTGPA
jgi:hypothetical protein